MKKTNEQRLPNSYLSPFRSSTPFVQRFFLISAVIGCLIGGFLLTNAEEGGGRNTSGSTGRPQSTSLRANESPRGTWADLNPFGKLSCFSENGVRINSSACSDDDYALSKEKIFPRGSGIFSKMTFALEEIKKQEFDVASTLPATLHECWSEYVSSLSEQQAFASGIHAGCPFGETLKLYEQAEVVTLAAANRGDFIAQEAYLRLLLGRLLVDEQRLHLFDPNDASKKMEIQTLEENIFETNRKIVGHINSLNYPSEFQKSAADTSSGILALRNTQKNPSENRQISP